MQPIHIAGSFGDNPDSPVESADSLASTSTARFVDLVSEGPIYGLVNGQNSIFINGVPLRDNLGSANYNYVWDRRNGGADNDIPMPGFLGTEQDIQVGVTVTVAAGPVVKSIPNCDAVRVTLGVNGLMAQDNNGNTNGTTVAYSIEAQIAGAGVWTPMLASQFTGKTRSHFQRSHEIVLSVLGTGPYNVRVIRATADSQSGLVTDQMTWDNATVINYEKLRYPFSALVGVQIDARYFTEVPSRWYHVRGRLVQVPANYTPGGLYQTQYATTGSGTNPDGSWDGTFKLAYTNNPAWCYYDMLSNTRYGAGKRIDPAVLSAMKWDLYKIARYCDEPVPTGLTGGVTIINTNSALGSNGSIAAPVPVPSGPFEPRFTLNVAITTDDDAQKLLGQLASAFRGMTYWASGSVMATQDSPASAVMTFTNANVGPDGFNYEGSSRGNRHTTVLVGWNDPEDNFRQKWEYVEDRDGIQRYGVRNTQIVAFGCSSRSAARRAGLWMLVTERVESDAITFTAGQDAAYLKPGDIINIVDNDLIGMRWGGRITAGSTTSVTVDKPLQLTAGSYSMSIMLPDGTMSDATYSVQTDGSIIKAGDFTITTDGVYSTITFVKVLPQVPLVNAVFGISSSTVSPMQARVIGIKPSGTTFELTVLQHVPSKYDAIEKGALLVVPDYSRLDAGKVDMVTGLKAQEVAYKPTRQSPTISRLDLSWDTQSTNPLIRGYLVRLVAADGTQRTLSEVEPAYVTVTDMPPGLYTVYVKAVNQVNVSGPETSMVVVMTGIDRTPPGDVTGFAATQTVANGLTLSWNQVVDYVDFYEIRKGPVWQTAPVVWSGAANTAILGAVPGGATTYWITAVDTAGNYSAHAASVVVGAVAPGTPTISRVASGQTETLSWTVPTSTYAIAYYIVKYGTSYADGTTINAKVPGTSLPLNIDYLGSRTYWVAAVDTAGNVGVAGSFTTGINAPGVPTNIAQSFQGTNESISWTVPGSSIPLDHYEIRYGASWDTGTFVATSVSNAITRAVNYVGNRTYWVAAVDTAGNVGTAGSVATNVVAPPAPSIVYAIVGVEESLTWTSLAGSLPIVSYEIRYGTTFAGGTTLVKTATSPYSLRVNYSGPRTYWIAATDSAGNVGTPASVSVAINVPSDVQNKRVDIVDNNALLYWNPPAVSTLAIDRYEVRKGATWAGGTVVGSNGNSTFTSIFETQSGTYTYWITAVDTAGNYGSASSIVATISQPPDYTLRTSIDSTWIGALTNMIPSPDGYGIIGPVKTGQTWAAHYTQNVWTTPADQVAAGMPLYINPSLANANYDETFDYGTVLVSSTVTVTCNINVLQGTVTSTVQMFVKQLATDAWTSVPVGTLVYQATNFRYVRVLVTFTSTAGANLAQISSLNVKLSSKRIYDSGVGTITDATNGLVVPFNRTFVDADQPIVQPGGNVPLIPVVSFVDAPNPTNFTVFLYNQAGTKVTGTFSWSASGF